MEDLELEGEMMIETSEGKILTAISSAQIIRNLNNTYLIERANKLPYCKRNILLTMLVFWDTVYTDIVSTLVNNVKDSKRHWNVNSKCLDYIKQHRLANKFFTDFFFNFHEPLTLAFLRRLDRELGNGMPYIKKFDYVAKEMSELLNLACIELDGLSISCETFGGEPLCPSYLSCGINDCVDVDNVFFLMMNDEYKMEPGLFEDILDVAMSYLRLATDRVIMIVDYRNIHGDDYIFSVKARARYEKCMNVVEQVYFYHCVKNVSFARENSDLCKFIIPDKKSLNNVISNWKDKQELVMF